MMRSTGRKVTLLATIMTLTAIAYAPSRADAGTLCCDTTANTTVTCRDSNNCSGSITYRSCSVPSGLNSTYWNFAEVKCCSETFTSFTSSTGRVCGGDTIAASTLPDNPDTTLYAEGVWVRTCARKYVFTVRPS